MISRRFFVGVLRSFHRGSAALATALLIFSPAVSLAAGSTSILAAKCDAAMFKTAGKLLSCRLRVDSKAVKGGVMADYSKCSAKFNKKWDKLIVKGAGECAPGAESSTVGATLDDQAGELAAALSGSGSDPAARKCESAKLKETGKYSYCRLKEDSKAAKKGSIQGYTRCRDKFAAKWAKIEARGGSSCPTLGDVAAIDVSVVGHAGQITVAVSTRSDELKFVTVAPTFVTGAPYASVDPDQGDPNTRDEEDEGRMIVPDGPLVGDLNPANDETTVASLDGGVCAGKPGQSCNGDSECPDWGRCINSEAVPCTDPAGQGCSCSSNGQLACATDADCQECLAPARAAGRAPVTFPRITVFQGAVSALPSLNPPDSNVASGGDNSVVLASGNTYAALSTDGGATFAGVNPSTVFPSAAVAGVHGGLCCDQVIQYVPGIDRFVWLMQYWRDATGPNMLRIASASASAVVSSGATAWTYWDLPSTLFGLGTGWMDYPDLAVGDNHLYMSVDQVGVGLLVARISLAQVQAGGSINIGYTNPALSSTAYFSHLTQNTGDEIFWAGHNNSSQMQVFSLHSASNTYFWRNVNINSWNNTTANYTSTAADGTDWYSSARGVGGSWIIGAARAGNDIWFAWNAASGGGFAQPHSQLVRVNPSTYNLVSQQQVWNGSVAFSHPCLSSSPAGEISMSLAFGGAAFDASHAVGYWGDYVVYYPRLSDHSLGRQGDYYGLRRASPDANQFSASGYSRQTVAGTQRYEPHYILFGR